MSSQTIALAQINPLLGDLPGNAQLISQAAADAFAKGATVLVTPELSLTGYPPEDLLLRPAFIEAVDRELSCLKLELKKFPGLTVVVGHPKKTNAGLQNYASVLRDGEIITDYAKQELPNHEVFDEVRYFVPGNEACVFENAGIQYGLVLCEDAWHAGPAMQAHKAGAQILLVPKSLHLLQRSFLVKRHI